MTATTPAGPGPHNALVDVAGLRVGHHTAIGNGFTGTTVVLGLERGMVAGAGRGGAGPATRETDRPTASVERVHAIKVLRQRLRPRPAPASPTTGRPPGGSAGPHPDAIVPLVPGGVVRPGPRRSSTARRTPASGAAALAQALADAERPDGTRAGAAQGNVGAGTGAVVGGLKGGIGTASVVLLGGATVAALAAVNAAGTPLNPRTGSLLGAHLLLAPDAPDRPFPTTRPGTGWWPSPPRRLAASTSAPVLLMPGIMHTTLVVVATDATLTKVQCAKLAAVAQNGMAWALNPVHTMDDGDIVFAGQHQHGPAPDPPGYRAITAAGADVVTRAIVRAVLAAATTCTPAGQWRSWTDVVAGDSDGRPASG